MNTRRLILLYGLALVATATNAADIPRPANSKAERTLFDFDSPRGLADWQIVNDGVMGGRSSSKVAMPSKGEMLFSGNLSLENNGGFASTRSRAKALQLQSGDTIVLEVKGDGRKYTFNAYVPRRRMAFSYRTEFKTTKDEWTEVRIPLDQLVATSFGRVVRGLSLDPAEVSSIGILLGDKKPGPFQIAIRSISVIEDDN